MKEGALRMSTMSKHRHQDGMLDLTDHLNLPVHQRRKSLYFFFSFLFKLYFKERWMGNCIYFSNYISLPKHPPISPQTGHWGTNAADKSVWETSCTVRWQWNHIHASSNKCWSSSPKLFGTKVIQPERHESLTGQFKCHCITFRNMRWRPTLGARGQMDRIG